MAGNQVTARTETGDPVGVRDVERETPPPSNDPNDPRNWNPMGAPTVRVRVRSNAPRFMAEGRDVGPGDELDMTEDQARNASQWVDVRGADGKLQPVRTAPTQQVPRTSLAGMARHERVEALTNEQAALEKRLAEVKAQLAHEERTAKAESTPKKAEPAKG